MKSIIFTGNNANLVNQGLKTQTRRIIKLKEFGLSDTIGYKYHFRDKRDLWNDVNENVLKFCPYKIGQQLYVREAWKIINWSLEDGDYVIQYRDGSRSNYLMPDEEELDEDATMKLCQQCTDDCLKGGLESDSEGYFFIGDKEPPTRWRSPMFMPKWASRMQIEVTELRVERLHEISEEDAKAEGIFIPVNEKNNVLLPMDDLTPGKYFKPLTSENIHQAFYARLWESIHGKGSWELNPFVWAINFNLAEVK